MHWLSSQLDQLSVQVDRLAQLRPAADGAPHPDAREARAELRRRLGALVAALSEREGILASFAAHDGLLVDGHGDRETLEAMAAMSQSVFHAASTAGAALALGPMHQVLLSGLDRKAVFFALGEVRLGVLAPESIDLRTILAE